MKIWLFCICRNEAVLMPYFLRHYRTFCDRMIFWDDCSDDGTIELLKAEPKVELRMWPYTPGMVDDQFLVHANTRWQVAKGNADWVIWVDADEFIYHPKIRSVLERYLAEGVQLARVNPYGMVSEHPPTGPGQIYDEIKTGFPSPEWAKPVVFQPTMNTCWHVGRHSLNMDKSEYKASERAELKLLHYRYLGMEYMEARNSRNYSRMPDYCRKLSYGDNVYSGATKAYSTDWFRTFKNQDFPNVI